MNNYVYIKIKNINDFKIVTKMHEIGVSLYEVKSVGNDTLIKIKNEDYEKVKKYLCVYKIDKVKYSGKIYIKNIIKKYKLLILSLICACFIVAFLSNIIVDIKIEHENEKIVDLLTSELEKYGIKKYTFKKSYKELEKIKKEIKKNNLDEIDWLEITKKGMIYIVSVEERKINEEKTTNNYCHIYAKKSGIIKGITLLKGQAVININDYVNKGDMLISGDIIYNESIVNNVCASAKVYAESWYVISVSIPYKYYEKIKTGKKRNNVVINYNNIDYQIFKDRLENYDDSKKLIFDLLGLKIYIKKDEEIKKVVKTYSDDEIEKKALSLAKEKVNLKLNEGDEIISEKVLQKYVNDSTMDIDIFIITKEDIAQVKIAKKEDDL